jgi:hypothetical protein
LTLGLHLPVRCSDEEHEKEIDRQNQAIRDSHRFNSFAPETKNAVVRSHVDGVSRPVACQSDLTDLV